MLSMRSLSISAATVALTASLSFGAYMTGFDQAPFVNNASPGGIDSWGTSNSAAGVIVTTAQFHSSPQSVLIPTVSSGTTPGINRTFTSTEAAPADNVLSFYFRPDNDSTVGHNIAWFYAYVGKSGNDNVGRLKFYLRNPQSSGGAPSIQYNITGYQNDVTQYLSVPAGTWTTGQWNSAQFVFHADSSGTTDTFDLKINGSTILSNLTIGDGSATHISRFDAYSQKTNLYVDDVRVAPVPEPGALGALMVGGLLLLRRK